MVRRSKSRDDLIVGHTIATRIVVDELSTYSGRVQIGAIQIMFPSASSPKGTLARYVPQNHESQNLEAASFRFGEEESLKGIWKVVRKRKRMIGIGGLVGMMLAFLVCLIM